ncbi:hypothetical protein SAMN05421823_1238 [Catalinimonas alkaloidigena]|uniref:Uncharacterized protein n=1 Tax=Catalinimonas alkaloidigena TaxID=1075417 RepID=A0A1G9VRB0_9BACT|nr:hypothetical protein [Catalinimonas alkaloidigena]SDM74643.1 hypothetical protein SAMN05421823_1238 [Catalinimonas alkaloidigena]
MIAMKKQKGPMSVLKIAHADQQDLSYTRGLTKSWENYYCLQHVPQLKEMAQRTLFLV